jgi:GNAT superfamily N-acetyltransferase
MSAADMTVSLTARGALVEVGPLLERELDDADRIFRLAFATHLRAPEPATVFGDTDMVRTRWRAAPEAAWGARVDGELVGSNFATGWGAVGFFGPLTVHPDWWDQGIGRRLLEPTMDRFASWGTAHVGLFTFADSPKHIGLYQRFGFWPRSLTAVMAAGVRRPAVPVRYLRYSDLARDGGGGQARRAMAALTGTVLDGLDLGSEIEAVAAQGLGETIVTEDDDGLSGLAVCHLGAGTEAGTGTCYVKFAAARPGRDAGRRFGRLLDGCQDLAAGVGAELLVAGVNLAREEAFGALRKQGFATQSLGVTMHRPNQPGYSTRDSYVIDDWR